ncbi:hypothetical protein KVV02_008662 [Mortierella alpina]|uniref:Laccase n=1 Tax=Mortierella alpina TaxID=64518 RepID=A0A9P8ACK3_MORAP|nr:hypothetical protein KVV02_008662 [Mortierella alpina]
MRCKSLSWHSRSRVLHWAFILQSVLVFLISPSSPPIVAYAAPPAFTSTPQNRIFFWKVTSTTFAPDGVTRPVLLVNDKYPGPKIEVNRGDYITVVVENALEVPTSFHWHGLTMRGDPWYDGVPGMNQCPIPPGANFTYAFGTDNMVGTHWWHAHFENQYIDGLVGAMIIRDPPETNPFLHAYDEERNVLLSDWYHQPTGPLLAQYLSPDSHGHEPVPNNGLINGKGTFNCSNVQPASLACVPGERAVFHFISNRRYRLRIINTSAASPFMFSIDDHQLQVIEADGTDLNPVMVDRLPINAGQRYSVIVTANQDLKNYWMRAEMGTGCLPKNPSNLDPVILGEVRYQGAGKVEPTTTGRFIPQPAVKGQEPIINPAFSEACKDMDLYNLHPLQPVPILEPITNSLLIRISFKRNPADDIVRGYMNDITYSGGNAWNPTIVQNLNQSVEYEVDHHVMQIVKPGAIVQIVFDNSQGDEHPFHLHGHVFQVVAQGVGFYEEGKTPVNAVNPLRRDTATVPRNGFTVIRFKADNPGVWALHCHIEWHVTIGLVMQFVELPDQLRAMGIPDHVGNLCKTGPPKGFKPHTGFMP